MGKMIISDIKSASFSIVGWVKELKDLHKYGSEHHYIV